MAKISITIISAPLPEGWEGTPDEFRQQIFSTLTFEGSGAFLTGQVGGAMPTSNVGLYIDGQDLYTWDVETNTYLPIHTEEIGVVKPYLGSVAPKNYLLLDGSLQKRETYKKLYALIGDSYKLKNESTPDDFRLPNARGRTFFGAGTGDYNPLQDPSLKPGSMRELLLHQYGGLEWPRKLETKHVGQPAANLDPGDCMVYNGVTGNRYTRSVPPHIVCNWIVRSL
jgi:hypothetical protein